MRNYLMLALVVVLVSACASTGPAPTGRGSYKVGTPYEIGGVRYIPQEDYAYDETGIASWYGPGFHSKNTANGEVYDQHQLTAAHRTLPMPSLVRVTNLDNGKSVVVRVNDRGPFAHNRIIDMSERGAELLGFKGAGTAKVRVQILPDESRAIADAARTKGTYVPQSRSADVEAAPVEAVQRASLDNAPLTPTAPVDIATKEDVLTIERVEEKGRFLPPVEATQVEVPASTTIYVQAGAFTQKDNAYKLAQSLGHIGQTEVTEADVNGLHFYRVRLPAADVKTADNILARVIAAGNKSAKIIVDR